MRVTLRLSNLSSYSHRETGVTTRTIARITVTLLRTRRSREPLSSILITGLSPGPHRRAPSSWPQWRGSLLQQRDEQGVPGSRRGGKTVTTPYIPGWYGRVVPCPPWYTPLSSHRYEPRVPLFSPLWAQGGVCTPWYSPGWGMYPWYSPGYGLFSPFWAQGMVYSHRYEPRVVYTPSSMPGWVYTPSSMPGWVLYTVMSPGWVLYTVMSPGWVCTPLLSLGWYVHHCYP